MARASWYVAAGRWLKGVGAAQRREPRTGAPQIRRYGHGWETVASAPIGAGHRVGVGQRIGTSAGSAAYTSEMTSHSSFMAIGLGGGIGGGGG